VTVVIIIFARSLQKVCHEPTSTNSLSPLWCQPQSRELCTNNKQQY